MGEKSLFVKGSFNAEHSCFYFIQHKPSLCNLTGGMNTTQNTTGVVMVVESPAYHSGFQNLSGQGPLN